jgi:hypothetical protein
MCCFECVCACVHVFISFYKHVFVQVFCFVHIYTYMCLCVFMDRRVCVSRHKSHLCPASIRMKCTLHQGQVHLIRMEWTIL